MRAISSRSCPLFRAGDRRPARRPLPDAARMGEWIPPGPLEGSRRGFAAVDTPETVTYKRRRGSVTSQAASMEQNRR